MIYYEINMRLIFKNINNFPLIHNNNPPNDKFPTFYLTFKI